jgi:hemerythrin
MNATIEPLLAWHVDYSLGLPQIDEQHQHIFNLMNRVWMALNIADDQQATAKLLDELCDFAQTHFDEEEVFMDLVDYPMRESHTKAHRAFIKRLRSEQTAMLEGSRSSLNLLLFLKDWLISHVLVADREYADFAGYASPLERATLAGWEGSGKLA